MRSGVLPLKQTNKIAFLPRIRNDDESSASIGRIVITRKERSVINIDAEAPPSESSALTKAVVEGYPRLQAPKFSEQTEKKRNEV